MSQTETNLPPAFIRVICADLETGGVKAAEDALTQAAFCVIEFSPGDLYPRILDVWEHKIKVAPGLAVREAALKVQGKTWEQFAKEQETATDDTLAFHLFRVWYEKWGAPMIASHNAEFEEDFLDAWAMRGGVKAMFRRGTLVCTQRLAAYCRLIGVLPPGTNSMDKVLAEFGAKRTELGHDGDMDCKLCAVLLVRLVNAIRRTMGGALPSQVTSTAIKGRSTMTPAEMIMAMGKQGAALTLVDAVKGFPNVVLPSGTAIGNFGKLVAPVEIPAITIYPGTDASLWQEMGPLVPRENQEYQVIRLAYLQKLSPDTGDSTDRKLILEGGTRVILKPLYLFGDSSILHGWKVINLDAATTEVGIIPPTIRIPDFLKPAESLPTKARPPEAKPE